MKKILHLTPVYKNFSETFIWEHINDYSSFLNTKVVCAISNQPYHEYISVIKGKDSNLLCKLKFKLVSKFFPIKYFNYADLKNVVRDYSPDIIHAHFGYFIGDLVSLSEDFRFTKLIISFHGTDLNSIIRNSNGHLRSLNRICLNPNITCVFPSDFLRQSFLNIVKSQPKCVCSVVYNPVNPLFYNAWSSTRINFEFEKYINLISVGRLVKVKGFEYAIKAIPMLLSKGIKVSYTLIGVGEDKDRLSKLVRKLGLQENVHFKGKMNTLEIISQIQASDIYIQPSVKLSNGQEESFGLAALEAAVTGIPVIVSESGGLPEVIDSSNQLHYSVTPNSPVRIAEKICKIIDIYYPVKLNENYLVKFSKDAIYSKWDDIYEIN
ncbi:glycosyltransferase family 4 protein [Shewanella marisflavi]|uniref:glycosyltransferase family 4 protein n=1 Tax=Shewanella marisflavi TaxID=260364 RepID=UPI003AAA683C